MTPAQVEEVRAAMQALIADFRTSAVALVDAAEGVLAAHEALEEYDDEVAALGAQWWVYLHDPHGRFESRADGTVVEAHLYRPELLDAGFLLDFARSSGRHARVVEVCRAGFPDMVVLLDALEPGWDDLVD